MSDFTGEAPGATHRGRLGARRHSRHLPRAFPPAFRFAAPRPLAGLHRVDRRKRIQPDGGTALLRGDADRFVPTRRATACGGWRRVACMAIRSGYRRHRAAAGFAHPARPGNPRLGFAGAYSGNRPSSARAEDIAAENLWSISIATPPPVLAVVKDGVCNVPRNAMTGVAYNTPANAGIETFFFDKPWRLARRRRTDQGRERDDDGIRRPMPSIPRRSSRPIPADWQPREAVGDGILGLGLLLVALKHPFTSGGASSSWCRRCSSSRW